MTRSYKVSKRHKLEEAAQLDISTEICEMSKEDYNVLRINARKYIVDNYDFVPIAQMYTDILEKEVLRFKKGKK